jgi:hypothetical protein
MAGDDRDSGARAGFRCAVWKWRRVGRVMEAGSRRGDGR